MKPKKSSIHRLGRHAVLLVTAVLMCLGLVGTGLCATYYVDGSAASDGNGSQASPKKYIGSGIALMSAGGGDTLIINNGTYAGSSNQITNLKNGTAGNYNTIQAANDGGVVVTAGLNMTHTNQYVQVKGIKFQDTNTKVVLGNHVKFFRCAFQGGPASGNAANVQIGTNDFGDSSYILMEDCWSYGTGGRYNFLIYNSNYIVLRRCIVRHDGGWTDSKGDPEAAVSIYNSSYVEVQNCIVIDSNLTTYHTWGQAYYVIYNSASPNATNNIHMRGNIALNVINNAYRTDGNGPVSISTFTDNIAYGLIANGDGYAFVNGGSSVSLNWPVTRSTAGSAAYGVGHWGSGSASINNSIIFKMSNADTAGGWSQSYLDRYSVGSSGSCSTGCQSYNPQANGLLYLPRIEAASTLASGGQSGGRIGADVTKKIGVSGTVYGETGYNSTTAESLWPWPSESRIKTDFASVASVGARGFVTGTSKDGSPQTLTKYIWEYLGNRIPSSVYGGQSLSAPTGLHILQ